MLRTLNNRLRLRHLNCPHSLHSLNRSTRYLSSSKEPTQLSQNVKIFLGLGITVISCIAGFLTIYPQMKEVKNDLVELLPHAIKNSKITESASKNYVERRDVEAKILAKYSSLGTYCVVYGPKGVGKSEVVDHTMINKDGVVKLMITTANSKDDIVSSLLMELLGNDKAILKPKALFDAIKKCEVIPTIIFDVERSGSPDQALGIQAVRGFAKMLAPFCRCIIVLSEANAVLEFGQDTHRERFIYVDEFTETEAREFLKRLEVKFSDQEMQYIFDNIGTSPAMLLKLTASVPGEFTLKQYVDDVLAQARQDLLEFPHQAILKALKEHPDGVSTEYFKKQEYKGVDLSRSKAVGVAMKGSNAIVYRIEHRSYQLMSTAHRTALKSYDPIL